MRIDPGPTCSSAAYLVGLARRSSAFLATAPTKQGLPTTDPGPGHQAGAGPGRLPVPSALVDARHGELLGALLDEVGTGGNLVDDAHLAALVLEHRGGGVVSYDADFGRFAGVRWTTPAALIG